MKKRKIRILIICAMLAANLAACVLFGGKTPAGVEDGGTAEETMSSTEAPTQDKVPQRSFFPGVDKLPQRSKQRSRSEEEVFILLVHRRRNSVFFAHLDDGSRKEVDFGRPAG